MQQRSIFHHRHVMPAGIFQLFEIQPGRGATDSFQVKHRNRLIGGKNLGIAMRPAEPRQIIAHPRRRIAHGLIVFDPKRAMPFGQFLAVRPMDQRNMGPDRHVPTHGIIDHCLTRRVVQVVIPPDHMADAHVVIIHDNRQHISGNTIRA